MSVLNEKVDDRALLIGTAALGIVGWVLFVDFSYKFISQVAFYFGFVLISLEFAMARNAVFTVFSKIIGPYPAGRYMGLMLAAGCLARALSPFWAMHLMMISIKACALLCSGALMLGVAVTVAFWEQCSAHQQNREVNFIRIDLNRTETLHEPLVFEHSYTESREYTTPPYY